MMFLQILVVMCLKGTPPTPVEKQPEPVRTLSLSDMLSRAITHNRGLLEAGLKVKTAQAQVKLAGSMFDTQLSADLQFVKQKAEFIPGQFFAITDYSQFSLDLQVARMLKTGGMVAVKYTSSRSDQTMTIAMGGGPPFENETKVFDNQLSLVVTHPLLAGFGVDVTAANLNKARIQVDAERISREARAQTLVRELLVSYWNLWLYWQEQELLETSLKVAKSQLELTKSLLTVGHAKPSDLQAVQNAVAQREGDLLLSRMRIVQTSLNIKSSLNLSLEDAVLLIRPANDSLEFAPRTLPANYLETVKKRSKELALMEKQMEALRQEELVARQGLLPKLNLTVTAGPNSRADTFREGLRTLVKFSGSTITAGLSFSWSVERTQAKAALEMLDVTAQNIRLQKENIANALVMGALLSRESLLTAEKRIELAKVAVQSAETHLKLENDLFSLGRGTNHSVLLRMAELDAARLSLIRAVYDHHIAWIQLQALSGTILEDYQLRLQD